MQNTKIVVVQGKSLLEALNQADQLFKTVFAAIDCQVQNMFVVPEAQATKLHAPPIIVCNVVIILVAADGVEWPENTANTATGGMKAIKE